MKNILVVRLSSLGDIILTQPVIEGLAKAGNQVTLLVQPAYVALVKTFPGCAHVVTSETVDQKVTYDLLLNLQGTMRASQAASKVRAKNKKRYKKYSLARRMLVKPKGEMRFWNKWSSLNRQQSVLHWYAQAAADVGYHGLKFNLPRLKLPETALNAINDQLEQLNPDKKPIVAMAVGAKWATKCWPVDYFIETAQELIAKNYLPCFVGTTKKEIELSQIAVNQLQGKAISLAGKTDLVECGALLSKAVLFIGNDSGPMHLSLAVGTAAIAFFGPTVEAFGFKPQHANAAIMETDLNCRPCSIHGSEACPLGHHDCMNKITPQMVLAKANVILGSEH